MIVSAPRRSIGRREDLAVRGDRTQQSCATWRQIGMNRVLLGPLHIIRLLWNKNEPIKISVIIFCAKIPSSRWHATTTPACPFPTLHDHPSVYLSGFLCLSRLTRSQHAHANLAIHSSVNTCYLEGYSLSQFPNSRVWTQSPPLDNPASSEVARTNRINLDSDNIAHTQRSQTSRTSANLLLCYLTMPREIPSSGQNFSPSSTCLRSAHSTKL
jgi:hypothetical protein